MKKPNEIVAARLGSPLAIGVGEGEFFIASDASPFLEYTNNAVYLEDEEMAIISLHNPLNIRKIKDDRLVSPYVQELKINLEQIEKGGYDHFMLKEIFEQPHAIKDTYRGRLLTDEGIIKMAGIEDHMAKFLNANRIIIVACGTSWHAGLVAEYIIEELVRVPVEVEYASEFRYRNPVIDNSDVVIAISQSGETADTFAALELCKKNKMKTLSIVNVVESSIARNSDLVLPIHCGAEIGVASTKAFTGQMLVLYILTLKISFLKKNIDKNMFEKKIKELKKLPKLIKATLSVESEIENISNTFANAKGSMFLGRGFAYPIAMEGALKLKELCYVHAEGYPAGEMKHGPLALIEEGIPVVVLAPRDKYYEKTLSNMQEVISRGAKVLLISNKSKDEISSENVWKTIEVEKTSDELLPFLLTLPLQILAFHSAKNKGYDIDKPRNLAKSVTVE